jgi:hypothetical protein
MQIFNYYELSKPTALEYGHAESIFTMGPDKMISLYTFQKPFVVILPDHCEWEDLF